MKKAWIVASIFALQTVLAGAAPLTVCAIEVQRSAAGESCCDDQEQRCCNIAAQLDDASEPAAVTLSPSVQLVATSTGTARPVDADTDSSSFRLTAEPHPTGLWSESVCAERAPPLS